MPEAYHSSAWSSLAIATLLLEAFICIGLQVRGSWKAPTAIAMVVLHSAFGLSGLQIGFFSLYLIAFCALLCLPRRSPTSRYYSVTTRALRYLFEKLPQLASSQWRSLLLHLSVCAVSLAAVHRLVPLPLTQGLLAVALLSVSSFSFALLEPNGPQRLAHRRTLLLMLTAIFLCTMAYSTTTVPTYHWEEAQVHARSGNLTQALASFRRVAELEPHNADAHADLAFFLELTDHGQEAFELNKHILIELDTTNIKVRCRCWCTRMPARPT